jgi:hypothetical protein
MIKEMDKNSKVLQDVIKQVQDTKRVFLKPKALMQKSIENDAQYLLSLGQFIQEGQKQVQIFQKQGKSYEASKLQVEVLEAIGKYQSNENIVNEKQTHYEKVFLPMYEEQIKESNEKFEEYYEKCKKALSDNESNENAQVKRILNFISKEIKDYEDYPEKEEEFQSHTYKIFKRLIGKLDEELARL